MRLEPRRAIPKPIDIEQILKSHRLAQQHHKNYKEAAIATGELLHVVKDGLPHGEFGPWLKEHCAEIKRSTAARYMRLARQISTGVEISSLSRAYGIKTKPYRQWTAAA